MEVPVMKNRKTLVKIIVVMFLFGLPINLFAKETVKKDSIFDLSLETLLNTDVTTASKSAEKLSDSPGIISVITKDELERFGGTTVKDILERVP
jgi:outer membrane receptor for ferrienterochelin and colicin